MIRVLVFLCSLTFLQSFWWAYPAAALQFDNPTSWLVTDSRQVNGTVEFGDVTGDGQADAVIYDMVRGYAWVAVSDGVRFGEPRLWAGNLPYLAPHMYYVLADVNGDRKRDVVVFVHGSSSPPATAYVYVAYSSGAKFIDIAVRHERFCITEQVCKAADVNADGRADIVAFTPYTGLVWVALSDGLGFGGASIWHNYFCIQFEQCELGDVEGDTRADLIVFKPKAPGQERGNVLVASSSGNDFGGIRYGHGYFCIDIEICRMGDFNGDGKIDVLLVKKPNPIGDEREIFVSLSNGSTFTNTQPFLWKTFSTSASINVHIADANGDRRDDVIFTQSAGTLTTYFVMDVVDHSGGGSSGASPPSAATGFGSVLAYNCTPEQYRVYYWVFDWTSGGLYSIGPADAMYSETGSCPDPADDSAVEVELKADHIHEIRVVVPDAIGCEGQNDPQIGACVRYSRSFVGQSNGGVFHWAVPE